MRLGDDAHATIRGIDEEPRHRDLRTRVEVNFGLLDIDKLPRLGPLAGRPLRASVCETPNPRRQC